MPRLTKKIIENADVRTKDYFIPDGELPGFSLRVLASGRKSFTLQYRIGNKTRRLTLGMYGILTPEAARTKAIQLLAQVHDGKDPVGERQEALAAPTVKDLAERFRSEYCPHRIKPSTMERYEQLLDEYIIPMLGDRDIETVNRTDAVALHTALATKKPTANRVVALLSVMFNQAEVWGWREGKPNPVRHVKKYKEKKRERYLNSDELRRLGETLVMAEDARLINHHAISAFKLLILTGARCGEIQTCRWDYVDLASGLIRLPDSKTGAKIIHLGQTAINVLTSIRRLDNNPFVIASERVPGAHINNLQGSWQLIRKWADLDNVRIHDLRHTFASRAVAMGMNLPMIGRLLGHTQTQTTDRYAHLATNPVLEAANKVTSDIGGLLCLPTLMSDVSKPAPADNDVNSELVTKLRISSPRHSMIDAPVFLTSAETASYLQVKKSLMDWWRTAGKGPPYVKVGNSIRYKLEDLQKYIATNR